MKGINSAYGNECITAKQRRNGMRCLREIGECNPTLNLEGDGKKLETKIINCYSYIAVGVYVPHRVTSNISSRSMEILIYLIFRLQVKI